jgi:large subunit ribosomal protein L4
MKLSKMTSNKNELVTLDAKEALFGCEFNKTLVHQVVNVCFHNSHTGTKAQKSRADVRGGGRKPWRQKGMGRARAGSSRSPLWRAGGVTFAAKPLKTQKKVNKKMFQGAIASIFSSLVREKRLLIIEPIHVEQPKTKAIVDWIKQSGIEGSILFILKECHENFALSIRNIPNIDACDVNHLNPLQLISFDFVLLEEAALTFLQERVG